MKKRAINLAGLLGDIDKTIIYFIHLRQKKSSSFHKFIVCDEGTVHKLYGIPCLLQQL